MPPLSTEFRSDMFDGSGDAGDTPGKHLWPKVMIHIAGGRFGGVPKNILKNKRIVGMIFVGNGSQLELQDPDRQRRTNGASTTNWEKDRDKYHFRSPVSGCMVRNS